MRNTTEKFNTEETIKNIAELLDLELEEIPHYDFLVKLYIKQKIKINRNTKEK